MVTYDHVVVGAGIVGAATAYEWGRAHRGASVALLDKESVVGRHQSSHNSGVIHAGIYYEPGSLKAELCRAGRRATEEFVADHALPYRRTGKMLVATTGAELARLEGLAQRAAANRIEAHRIGPEELREREPHVAGLGALHLPATGITDYGLITERLASLVQEDGGEVLLGTELHGVVEASDEVVLQTSQGEVTAGQVVFCAGVQADRVARMAGVETDIAMLPFRGEYYDVRASRAGLVSHLIYPVPDPSLPFLGVHLTPTVAGGLHVGPNAVLALAREGYPRFSFESRDAWEAARFPGTWRVAREHWRTGAREVWNSWSKRGYLELCRRYCPDLGLSDLLPREAGIRAQAVRADGSFVHDFLLHRTRRTLHVLNAPSPAATSALPIAARIVREVAGLR